MVKNKWILSIGAIGMLLVASALMGQTIETTQAVQKADSLFALLFKGGIVMIPLALCSVMAVTISLERFISLGRRSIIPAGLDDELDKIFSDRGNSKMSKARSLCEEHPSPLADIYTTAIDHWEHEANDVDKVMGDVASLFMRKMRRTIRPLRLIGSVSPLLGLLGTVVGMIRAFQTVALSSQSINKAELLADGIYQAMVTTATGLCIAIPTLIVFFYFSNRIDKIGEELEEKGNSFVFKYFRSRLKLGN
jgi:biopolymer transport protein ExbB